MNVIFVFQYLLSSCKEYKILFMLIIFIALRWGRLWDFSLSQKNIMCWLFCKVKIHLAVGHAIYWVCIPQKVQVESHLCSQSSPVRLMNTPHSRALDRTGLLFLIKNHGSIYMKVFKITWDTDWYKVVFVNGGTYPAFSVWVTLSMRQWSK